MRLLAFSMCDKVVPYIQYIVDEDGKKRGVEILLRSQDKEITYIGDLLRHLTIDERVRIKVNLVSYLTDSYLKEQGIEQGFVNINVSRVLLANDHFVDALIQCATNNTNYKINVELLENEHHTSDDSVFRNLIKLSDSGVGIYIDDFGDGSFSFDLVNSNLVDGIKLSRDLMLESLSTKTAESFCFCAIDYFKSKGIKVIGEGVENLEQVKFAIKVKCDLLQGFYFSRPVQVISSTNMII